MSEKRTDPRVHCYQRPINGGYVPQAATTTEHLRAVFAAEQDRIAKENAPRRRRRAKVATATEQVQSQLQLVA